MSRSGVVGLSLIAMLLLPGCAASRGASLYRAGTRAMAQGETDRAIANLEAANELLPDRSEILNHLAIAYDSVGRNDEALALFERAAEIDCRNAAAESNLTVAKQRAARHEAIVPSAGEASNGSTDPVAPAIERSGRSDTSTPDAPVGQPDTR